jgi:3-oxoadipate CoA-transferase, alpha subunit
VTVPIFPTAQAALFDVKDGATIMFGGFVSAGSPSNLILGLKRRGTKHITVIANNIGLGDKLDELCETRQVDKVIATFAIRASGARSSRFEEQYRRGEVELELVPQGTFAERIRAGGAGLGGFLTRTGVGTVVQDGGQVVELDGTSYLLETPLHADVALIRAERADAYGNLVYRKAGRNFNPLMATAADRVIVEVSEIVPAGALDPETVGTPAVYVDRLVKCAAVPVRWE